MTSTSFKFAFSSLVMAAGMAATTAASALTLPTQDLKANAFLVFSVAATGSTSAAGVTFAPAGNTTKIADVVLKDTQGNNFSVPQYQLPVTKTDVSVGWDLKVTPNNGVSTGAALRIATPNLGGDVALANFYVDFKAKIIYADLIDIFEKTTEKRVPIYSFVDIVPSNLSLKNLVVNFTGTLGKLTLTPTAVEKLGNGLLVDPVLRSALASLEWGTLRLEVTSYKRPNKISNKDFTLADVK